MGLQPQEKFAFYAELVKCVVNLPVCQRDSFQNGVGVDFTCITTRLAVVHRKIKAVQRWQELLVDHWHRISGALLALCCAEN